MKKAILLIGVIGGLAIAAAVWFSTPRYQGRSADAWIDQLQSPNPMARREAKLAVQSLGSNAVPALVENLQAEDSFIHSNLVAILRHQDLLPVPQSTTARSRGNAVLGFAALGAESEAAVAALVQALADPKTSDYASYALIQMNDRVIPALLIAATNESFQVRRRVIGDLGSRHQNAPGIEAVLIERLRQDPDRTARSMAGIALGQIRNLSPTAIAALVEALGDSLTFMIALQALGEAGTNARPAIPVLERVAVEARKYGANGAMAARRALAQIDPTVLTRLRIAYSPVTNRYE